MVHDSTGKGGCAIRSWDEAMAEHEGLVRWVVRRQRRGVLSFEDALHAGRLGLWRALQHFDPDRGTQLSTYAVPAIAHAVWRAAAESQQHPAREVALSAAAGIAVADAALEAVHEQEVRTALWALVVSLPARERAVMIAHYGLGGGAARTFAALGHRWGISRQRVQQLHGRALCWLGLPEPSRTLRRLLDRQSRADYQQALARQRRQARRGRR